MRIAYLAKSDIPSRQANCVHVMKMCQALARNGHEVTLYATYGPETVDDDFAFYGVDRCFELVKCRYPGYVGRSFVFARRLAWQVRRRPRPDLLYGRYTPALQALTGLGVPVGYEAHSTPKRQWLFLRRERRLFAHRHFAGLVCITRALATEYENLFPGVLTGKITVAPDGADPVPPALSDEPIPVDGTRAGVLQLGYVGHLYAGRGIDVIVAVARGIPEADVHVIGGRPRDIESWRQQTRDVTNLHLHGFVSPPQAERYRLAMDVLLAPYQRSVAGAGKGDTGRWMSPMKLFEYMAAGKAIVCSDLPVLREVLRDGDNALLVPPDDVGAWVRAVRTLAGDTPLRQRLGDRARAELEQRYTWACRARNIVKALLAWTDK